MFTEFLTIEPSTIIFTLLNLLILFLLVRHFLFDKVNKVLEDRIKEVENDYDEAQKANHNAKTLENEYTQKLNLAKEESAEIIKTSTKKAQLRYDEIVSEAKDEVSNLKQKANSEIEREKKRAINQMKDEISDIAFMVATKVVEKEINPSDNDKMIEEFINNVGEL